MTVLIEGDGGKTVVANTRVVHGPGIRGCISGAMGWQWSNRCHGSLREQANGHHIAFVERQGVFGQDDIASVGSDGCSDP